MPPEFAGFFGPGMNMGGGPFRRRGGGGGGPEAEIFNHIFGGAGQGVRFGGPGMSFSFSSHGPG